MDVCQQEKVLSPSCSKLSNFSNSLDDLFSAQNTEVDVSLEWLSVFVEDCFSSQAASCCLFAPSSSSSDVQSSKPSTPSLQKTKLSTSHNLQNFVVPGKARSKRKRLSVQRNRNPLSIWSHHLNPKNETLNSDPPLLKQTYWLADSELIVPKKEKIEQENGKNGEVEEVKREGFVGSEIISNSNNNGQNPMMPRRCSHCLAQRTPQWRAGPLGPKTLCNACGVRYKSGRLLPEYRPAKSPTFVSYLHSNSHKKVMEMRMATSVPPNEHH